MKRMWLLLVAWLSTSGDFTVLAAECGDGGAASVPKSSNPVLHTLLTPVGKAGVFLLDQIASFLNFTKVALANLIGADVDGGLYSLAFVVIWVIILMTLWFLIKRLHEKLSDEMSRWGWVRFIALASGFCCVMFHLFSGNTTGTGLHPDDYWQAALIPTCGLLLSLVVAFAYVHRSYRYRSLIGRAIGLVLLDFSFGFFVAAFFKITIWIFLVIIAFKACELLAMLGGGSGKGGSEEEFFEE